MKYKIAIVSEESWIMIHPIAQCLPNAIPWEEIASLQQEFPPPAPYTPGRFAW